MKSDFQGWTNFDGWWNDLQNYAAQYGMQITSPQIMKGYWNTRYDPKVAFEQYIKDVTTGMAMFFPQNLREGFKMPADWHETARNTNAKEAFEKRTRIAQILDVIFAQSHCTVTDCCIRPDGHGVAIIEHLSHIEDRAVFTYQQDNNGFIHVEVPDYGKGQISIQSGDLAGVL